MTRFVVGLAAALLAVAAPQLRADETHSAPAATGDPSQAKIAQAEADAGANAQDPGVQYRLGNAYYDAGRVVDAIRAYEQAVALDSTYKEALVNLGNAYNETGKLNDAVATFEHALRIDPSDDKALSNLGNSYYALGQYMQGMAAYKRALVANPKCHQAHYNIGVAFADAGIYREAVREWLKVIELAPGTPDAESAHENVKVIEKILGEKYIDESKAAQGTRNATPQAGGAAGSGGAH